MKRLQDRTGTWVSRHRLKPPDDSRSFCLYISSNLPLLLKTLKDNQHSSLLVYTNQKNPATTGVHSPSLLIISIYLFLIQ